MANAVYNAVGRRKGSVARAIIKHLKVYIGEDHPHSAQQPKILEF